MYEHIDSVDIPQQDKLTKVRAVVEAISRGVARDGLADAAALSPRHVRYTLHAARTLGWATRSGDNWTITPRGVELLAKAPGTAAEKEICRLSISGCHAIHSVVPELLESKEVELETVAARLITFAGLSRSTAQRRAITLLSWREQVLPEQEKIAVEVAPAAPSPVRPSGPIAQLDLFG